MFSVLPPKFIDCTQHYTNVTNVTNITNITGVTTSSPLNRTLVVLDKNLRRIIIDGQTRKLEPAYNYSKEYGRSVLTDVRLVVFRFCLKRKRSTFIFFWNQDARYNGIDNYFFTLLNKIDFFDLVQYFMWWNTFENSSYCLHGWYDSRWFTFWLLSRS